MDPDGSQIPRKRPHFRLRDGKLYFLISKRPYLELGSAGEELWNAIDGVATVDALDAGFPGARGLLEGFQKREIIEWTPAAFREDRKRVLVIEPHMDDAVLSVGGMMWMNRGCCEFTVVSVVGRSNFTSYQKIGRDYFDIDEVSALRRRESELVMEVLGGAHVALEGLDAPLRYHDGEWTLDWFLKNRRGLSAFINHRADEAEVAACTDAVERLLMETAAREVWIPLGVGTSADHEMTRDACLLALRRLEDAGRRFDVFLYQDVPYARQFPRHTEQILAAMVSGGASIERIAPDITDVMPEKLRLISIFASQFKMGYMSPRVEATARLAGGSKGRLCEVLVRVDKLPGRIDRFGMYSGNPDVTALRGRLAKWLPGNRMAPRIDILCPMGAGRWKEYMEALLHGFPNADFVVHLTEDACDETERFSSPRIRIRPVHGRAGAWILRLLGVMFRPSCPLIVFTGTRHRSAIPLLRAAFALSKPLPTTTLGHLVQALSAGNSTPGSTCSENPET